jgi:glycerophosphoryl diester phosphodiesterase
MEQGPSEPDTALPNTFENLFFNAERLKQMVIVGHRGGFKPANSLHSFQKAKEHSLQAVELDVSFLLPD